MDTDLKSLGVKHLLRKLRNAAPQPLTSTSDLEDELEGTTSAMEEAAGNPRPAPGRKTANRLLPRGGG